MTGPESHLQVLKGLRVTAALLALGLVLSGCASVGETVSPAFADPAKYELWDCKQLEPERKQLAKRAADLQGLMAKADSGVAGPVVAELAYRNDYVAIRGQAHYADEAWRRNNCHESVASSEINTPVPAPPSRGRAVR